jgi:hypothetical protein
MKAYVVGAVFFIFFLVTIFVIQMFLLGNKGEILLEHQHLFGFFPLIAASASRGCGTFNPATAGVFLTDPLFVVDIFIRLFSKQNFA